MNLIVKVIPRSNKIVAIHFSDGFTANLDVSPFIKGGISERLRDPSVFNDVHVDEFGGISWANGFDFCPNFLRAYLQSNQPD